MSGIEAGPLGSSNATFQQCQRDNCVQKLTKLFADARSKSVQQHNHRL